MKLLINIILILFFFNKAVAENHLQFFLDAAFKNNLELNAERKNQQSIKENINISRSEFLPSVSFSGSQTSSESTSKTNQSGAKLSDSNLNSETTTISVDQKIFQGFKGYNSLKKSELEFKQADYKLKQTEQQTILDTTSAYFDFIFKTKNEKFNLSNVFLFERQVESDSARLQKGEITLTDLAQSESSLAGANADLIKAKTELLSSKTNFERITKEKVLNANSFDEQVDVNLPKTLQEAINTAKLSNSGLLIAKLDYQISEKELNIEKARLSPSASINYSKSENKDFSSTIDQLDQENVKATVTWPIVKGGENISSIKKSSLNKQRALLLAENVENKVVTNTTNAWSKYQSSQSVLRAIEAQLKAAEIANEGITLEYDSGNTRTTLEVIQSTSLLLDARISFAKAERDYIISKFELAFQIGTLSLKSISS
ncbi:TolC family protein [Pelagibacteraceae bacterium]|nr:TolC family protein [Pelagibacteraceae bacterium]MDC0340128.1 TolC family protein [Pelagibacteraceae bacterium]